MGSLNGVAGALAQGSLASLVAVFPDPPLPPGALEALAGLYGSLDLGPAGVATDHLLHR